MLCTDDGVRGDPAGPVHPCRPEKTSWGSFCIVLKAVSLLLWSLSWGGVQESPFLGRGEGLRYLWLCPAGVAAGRAPALTAQPCANVYAPRLLPHERLLVENCELIYRPDERLPAGCIPENAAALISRGAGARVSWMLSTPPVGGEAWRWPRLDQDWCPPTPNRSGQVFCLGSCLFWSI